MSDGTQTCSSNRSANTTVCTALTHASTPAPGSAGTVAVSVGDSVGDAVGDAAATTTVTAASDADRLCPGGTATVTVCEFVGRVLQWLRSHDAMLASLSGRKMRPFKPRGFSSASADRQLLLPVFQAHPILDRKRSCAVCSLSPAICSAGRKHTYRKPLMTCPPAGPTRRSGSERGVASWKRKTAA